MEILNAEIREKNGEKYLYLPGEGDPIQAEQDALDIISLCGEHGIYRVLIQGDRLSDDFFRLRTGVLGAVLQKFTQYSIKAAATLDQGRVKGKFEDFLAETNRGTAFRAYPTYAETETWLVK